MGIRHVRQASPLFGLIAVLLLLVVSCKGEDPPPTYEYTGYLAEEIPPCSPVEGAKVDPCEADAGKFSTIMDSSFEKGNEPRGMSHFLNMTELHVAHLVVRGTYLPNTVRCLPTGMLFSPPSYYKETWYLLGGAYRLNCYVDVRVNEYILGSGPPTLTVVIAFDHYGQYPPAEELARRRDSLENALVEGGYQGRLEVPEGGIGSREAVLFVGPAIDTATDAWVVMITWDVQRQTDDTVIAVHPYSEYWSGADRLTHLAALEMELPAFRQAVTAAHQARLTTHGGRTGPDAGWPMLQLDANRLDAFFTAIGAGDQVQPPPACGLSVTNQAQNPDLMLDCMALLSGKDELAGTATLNWGTGTAIGSWDGVTVEGTLGRVTKVLLDDEDLTDTIPASLGDLTGLTHLDLSDNSLTGEIPREIGRLDNLVEVRLSGNSLTGCIPYGLKAVTTNDMGSLGLLYCPPAPETLRGGESTESSLPLRWTAVANASKYRVEYQPGREDWVEDANAITATNHTVDGLDCKTEYQFRVSAYGDGTTYPAVWSDPSEELTRTTGSCSPPSFTAAPYSFTIRDDAPIGTVVGTVSATDDSGESVVYRISAYGPGLSGFDYFAIDEQTGIITTTAILVSPPRDSAEMVVQAHDQAGGVATERVAIEVTKSCSSGTAVANPSDNPGLMADCKVLLGLQSELAGTARH